MRFNCGPDEEERNRAWEIEKARLEEWHDFFAIWPRRVASHDCRWLETIQRKGVYRSYMLSMSIPIDPWRWEYRAK